MYAIVLDTINCTNTFQKWGANSIFGQAGRRVAGCLLLLLRKAAVSRQIIIIIIIVSTEQMRSNHTHLYSSQHPLHNRRLGYVVKLRPDPGYVVKQCHRIVLNIGTYITNFYTLNVSLKFKSEYAQWK